MIVAKVMDKPLNDVAATIVDGAGHDYGKDQFASVLQIGRSHIRSASHVKRERLAGGKKHVLLLAADDWHRDSE